MSMASTLCNTGKGSLFTKLDFLDTNRHIPVHSTDWNLLGFLWLGKYYYPVIVMFSSKSAQYIFKLFTAALDWIIQHHIPRLIHHYLDNFLPIFRPSVPMHKASLVIYWIEDLGKELEPVLPAQEDNPSFYLP